MLTHGMEEILLKWKKAILLQVKMLKQSYSESVCIDFGLVFQITVAKEEHFQLTKNTMNIPAYGHSLWNMKYLSNKQLCFSPLRSGSI